MFWNMVLSLPWMNFEQQVSSSRNVLFQPSIFRGELAVRFKEGTLPKFNSEFTPEKLLYGPNRKGKRLPLPRFLRGKLAVKLRGCMIFELRINGILIHQQPAISSGGQTVPTSLSHRRFWHMEDSLRGRYPRRRSWRTKVSLLVGSTMGFVPGLQPNNMSKINFQLITISNKYY